MKNKRQYPTRLLPKRNFHIISVDDGLDNFFLIRYSLGNKSIKKKVCRRKLTQQDKDTQRKELAKHFKASQFDEGLSVNLLSVYRKQDAAFIVGSRDTSNQIWSTNSRAQEPQNPIFYRYRGFVGIKIKNIRNTVIDNKEIKIGGVVIRKDKVYFKLEHVPTKCNFWHFNIEIYGINSITGVEYRLRNEPSYKNSQLSKVAAALLDQIKEEIKPRKYMHQYNIPYKYYK